MKAILDETLLLLRTVLMDRSVRITAFLILLGVLLLIFVYGVASAYREESRFASYLAADIGLGEDRFMAEIVNYGMAFLSSVLFFIAYLDTRSPILLFFSSLMAFIWFDDAALYHERFGEFLEKTYDLPALPGLRQQDSGELVAWAMAGAFFGVFLLICLLRRRAGDKGVLALVLAGFGAILFCGIVADLVHIAVPKDLKFVVGIFEDGGEILAVAFISGIALGLSRNGKAYYHLAAEPNRGSAKQTQAN